MGTNMKKLLVVLLTFAMCISLLPAAVLAAEGEGVAEGIAINETNFPDSVFREIVEKYDTDNDSFLSTSEIAAVKEIKEQRAGPIGKNKPIIDSLKGIEYFTSLETLWCWNNNLTSLDLAGNTALKNLKCAGNRLASLNLSENTALEEVDCDNMSYKAPENKLKVLILGNNTALKTLKCGYNELTELDVSGCTALEELNCNSNKLTSLDLSTNTALKNLECGWNLLYCLNVSGCNSLECLSCMANHLTSLNITSSGITAENFHCEGNSYQATSDSLNLTTLPGFDKEKIEKAGEAYECKGGAISNEGDLTFTSGVATYTYTCYSNTDDSKKLTVEFKIIAPNAFGVAKSVKAVNGDPTGSETEHVGAKPGDTVTIEVESNAPKGFFGNGKESDMPNMYWFNFYEKLGPGMTYVPGSAVVEIDGCKLPKPTADVKLYYIKTTGMEEGYDLEVDMDLVEINKDKDRQGGTNYFGPIESSNEPRIVVTYDAELDSDATHGSYLGETKVLSGDAGHKYDYAYVHTYAVDVFNYDKDAAQLTEENQDKYAFVVDLGSQFASGGSYIHLMVDGLPVARTDQRFAFEGSHSTAELIGSFIANDPNQEYEVGAVEDEPTKMKVIPLTVDAILNPAQEHTVYLKGLGGHARVEHPENFPLAANVPETELPAALSGAGFALYNNEGCAGDPVAAGVSGADGMTIFEGLLPGVYWLKQTKAPEGCDINDQVFEIEVDSLETLNKDEHIFHVRFANSKKAPKEDEPATPSYPSFGGGTPSAPTYTVTLPSDPAGGSITSDKSKASEGATVIITTNPEEGYELSDISVTGDKDNNPIDIKDLGNNRYSFKMPRGGVKIEASFNLIDTKCDGGENCPSRHLEDVDKTAWYHEAVDYVVAKALMKGTSATTFEPNTPTSRAMIVTILYRLEGNPEVAEGTSFKDVESGVWYTEAIKWAAANKIVNGYGNDMFGPNDPITREQMAAILYRYSQYKGYNIEASAGLSKYTDSNKIDAYALAPMNWAVAKGLIQGMSETKIDPLGNAVRSQVAAILMRFCEGVAK